MSSPDVVFFREPRVSLLSQPRFAEPEHLSVNRQGLSVDAELLAEYAARLRHMSHDNPSQRATRDYLSQFRNPLLSGAFEHANFSLLFEGISRSLANELTQLHSGVAVSELSLRRIDHDNVAFVIPPALLGDESLNAAWCEQMRSAVADYFALFDSLLTRYAWIPDKTQRRRIARDGACAVLPTSIATKLILTANAREWRSLIESCGHEHTDLESRRFAVAVRTVLHAAAPSFFDDLDVYTASDRHEAIRLRDR